MHNNEGAGILISSRESTTRFGDFLKQAIAVFLLAYLIIAGGTLNGLVRFPLHVVSHVVVFLVLCIWLGGALWRRRRIEATGLELTILVVVAAWVLATLLSEDLRRSLGWLGLMSTYVLFFYLVHDISRHGWPATLLTKSLLIVGGIVIAWGVVEILSWYLTWLSQSGGRLIPTQPLRLYTLLGDANMLSGFLNLLLPLAVIRLVTTRNSFSRLILLGWLAGNLLVQFFTSSRGGWLGTIVVIVSLVVFVTGAFGGWRARVVLWWKARSRPRWMLALVVGLALVAAAAIAYLAWHQVQHPTHTGILETRSFFWECAWAAFLSSPWYGTGPFTYSTQFIKCKPFLVKPYPHAHSLPMTTLAEGGVLGMLSLLALTVGLIRRLWQTWRWASFEQRLFMSGGLASLAGFGVHGLVDNHVLVPTIGMTAVGIAALTLSGGTQDRVDRHEVERGVSVAWFVVPAILLIAGSAWSDLAYYPFWRGVHLANRGDWSAAAPWFDIAAERDDRMAFYHLQQGYAWGVLADGEDSESDAGQQQALEKAIAAYERGVTLEPYYSLNHANLSALYWQAGDHEQAVDEMEQAIALTPGVVPYHLSLAHYSEELGLRDVAVAQYHEVLQKRSDLSGAGHFWNSTPTRSAALAEWESEHTPRPLPESPTNYREYLRLGWDAFDQGDWKSAEDAFLEARSMSPLNLEVYEGLARANIALGDYIRAETFLRRGLNIFTEDVGDKLDLMLTYGRVAHLQGRHKDAVKRYETALGMVEHPTIYGRGTIGWSPYGWFVFQRESIAPDMLPQLGRLEVTDVVAERLMELAGLYEELGQPDKAAQTYHRILSMVPGFEPAMDGLEPSGRQ